MTHTTPERAREIANSFHSTSLLHAKSPIAIALRSLADQIEAVTAERDSYKTTLDSIANANPKNWDAPHNNTASFQAWAQSRCRLSLENASVPKIAP